MIYSFKSGSEERSWFRFSLENKDYTAKEGGKARAVPPRLVKPSRYGKPSQLDA
jgi:hypothetical protein